MTYGKLQKGGILKFCGNMNWDVLHKGRLRVTEIVSRLTCRCNVTLLVLQKALTKTNRNTETITRNVHTQT